MSETAAARPLRGVALLSGGLDSAVAAALFARDTGTLACCLFCDYGQRAARPEAEAAARLAARFGAPLVTVALPWLGELARRSGSRLVAGTGELPHGTAAVPGDAASAAAVWVPARNVVLVAVAAAHAEAIGAGAVVPGFNREEAATFADNSTAFATACEAVLRLGTKSGVRIVAPTLAMDKDAIVGAARALGFAAEDFWSCYEGGPSPCGRCESCLRSRWRR